MPALSPEVRRLLARWLEERLEGVLPVEARVVEEGDGPRLTVGEETAFRLVLEPGGLPPGELRRWRPVARALAQALLDRLVEEGFREGRPGRAVLTRLVADSPLTGLLLRVHRPPERVEVFTLGDGLHFLPGGDRSLVLSLWREGVPFVALRAALREREDLEEAEGLLRLAALLGFTWLSSRALDLLEGLGLGLEHLEGLEALAEEGRAGDVLVWAEGPESALACLARRARGTVALSGERALFAFRPPLGEVRDLLRDLSLRAGVLPAGEGDLSLLWAAYEHARRLPQEEAVVFAPYSLHALGDVFLDLDDLGAARRAYLFALEGTAQPVELMNSLAVVMAGLGDRQAARFFLTEAVRTAPSDPMLHYNLALFLEEEGLAGDALAHLKEAHSLAPEEALFAEALAERWGRGGSWERVRDLLAGRRLSPRGTFLLARACYELGDLEEALRLFRRVLDAEPGHRLALAYTALLFVHLRGEFALAEALVQEMEGAEGELGSLVQDLKVLMEGRR